MVLWGAGYPSSCIAVGWFSVALPKTLEHPCNLVCAHIILISPKVTGLVLVRGGRTTCTQVLVSHRKLTPATVEGPDEGDLTYLFSAFPQHINLLRVPLPISQSIALICNPSYQYLCNALRS